MGNVTIYQVAKLAGVGRSTVSRVLNDAENVAPHTRELVKSAIAELGYIPSRAARSLVTKHTNAIGLVIPEEVDRFFSDPFFAEIMSGITGRIADSEYTLNVMLASGDAKGRNAAKVVSFVSNRGVDGVIVVGNRVGDTFIDELTNKVPLVFAGHDDTESEMGNKYCVDTDNRHGGYLAAKHLMAIGRKRLATITGPHDMASATDRQAGFLAALGEEGLTPVCVLEGDYSPKSGRRMAREMLSHYPCVDGVFVGNDLMAKGVLDVLSEEGVVCPREVAIVGFDDSVVAVECQPQLTTIRQTVRQLGTTIADVLLRVLANEEPPKSTVLPVELIVRESA